MTIDEQLERKLLAISAFVSQVQVRAYLEPDMIKSSARYWSRYGDGRYAEAFEVIREAAMNPSQPLEGPIPVGAPEGRMEVPHARYGRRGTRPVAKPE